MKRPWDASEEASRPSLSGDLESCHNDRQHAERILMSSLNGGYRQQNHNTRSISPPPLTRKRTSPGGSMLNTRQQSSSALSAYPSLDSAEVKRSIVQLPGLRQKEQAGIQQSHRSSSLSLATYNPQRIDCQNSLRHMPSIMAISEPDAGSGSPKKLVCRTCNKASTTKYDPIILCPSCRRPYHDSCRAPPLRDGLDPNTWKCWKCLGNRHKRISSAMTTSRIPAVPSKPLKPSKPSVVRLDQPVPPKEMVTSTDHSKLRRLPSFTTYLRPAADSTASKYVGSNKSIPRKDLHLNEDNKILRETLPRESIEHYDSRSMPGCERDNFSGDIKNLSLFDRERENGQARKSTDLLTKPKGASNFYEQLQSPLGEYSEVLDTPWQRSDQPDGSDPRTESLDRGHKDTDSNSDAPVFVGYSTPKKNAACTMSGPIYEHQITVGQDTEDPECPSSRPWITSSGTEGPTIPETPNAFRETNDAGSGSPEVVKCTPVATQDLTTGPVSTAQSSPISMLSESDNTKPDDLPMTAHDALRQSQQADQTATREPYGKGASCSAELDDTCEASTNHHPSNETSVNKETVSNVALPESLVPLHVGDRVADNDLCSAKSSLNRHGDASMNDQDVGEGEKPTPKSMVEDSRPTTPCPEEPCNDVMPPHRVGTGNTPVSETTSESQPRRRVTNRERARMALAAAGGQRLTTAEIVDWNLQMFPHLNEKQISLERNITAVLSIFSEFKGKKILGARGNKQLWGFADTNIQRQYQREYAGYYTSLANPTAQRKDRVLVAHLDSSNATTKRQDDARPGLKEVMDGRPIDEVATPDKSEAMLEDVVVAESEECDTSSSASPDTHGSHQALSIDSLSGGRFFEECFSHQTPLLEAMTQTDIDRKVSEIKQRPSRKRFFGPEHRLAHVRRYGRQDIHDESEGAWKQGLYDKVKTTAGSTSADVGSKDGEGVATVRQLFNLPKNAIPMNSGQTELAFRDGTLIGGKLPRPRQIHKVGKMFGGELTIRTS